MVFIGYTAALICLILAWIRSGQDVRLGAALGLLGLLVGVAAYHIRWRNGRRFSPEWCIRVVVWGLAMGTIGTGQLGAVLAFAILIVLDVVVWSRRRRDIYRHPGQHPPRD